MHLRVVVWTLLVAVVSLLWGGGRLWADEGLEFFEAKIRPLFVEYCQSCHGEKKQEGSLRLDSKQGWETGGDQGRAIVPGKPKDSLLIKMVRGGGNSPPEMPPDNRLPPEAVADLVKWIEMGAPDPRSGMVTAKIGIDWETARQHWAYQPVKDVAPPAVIDKRFQQPIDRFVRAKLRETGLTPAPHAEKRALLRRVTFGLIGLPPTQAEVQDFLTDDSPEAYAKVVDRLLASPQYGERQARMWLDVARFAEDQAQSKDKIADAWRYRDWVVTAFNEDLPYDAFLKYQLAADLMPQQPGDHRHFPALGLLGLGTTYPRPNDLARLKADEWDDRIDTITRGMLALTVSCARCHDHKFDPIPTQDYYSLAGVMASTTRDAQLPFAPPETIAAYDQAKAEADAAAASAQALLQEEADRVALLETGKFSEYALHVWRYHARKLQQADLTWEMHASNGQLDAKALQALDSYLRRDRGPDHPVAKWRSLLPKAGGPTEPSDEVRAVAEAFLAHAKRNLEKPLAKRDRDQQKDLFGDKGVIPLTEETLIAGASDAWKTQYAMLKAAADAARERMPPAPPTCQGVKEEKPDKIKDLKVYLRGDPAKKGEVAPRRFLRILAGDDAPRFTQGSGRLELAEAIADPDNPLTARVMVNRLWQQHFGRGLVRTASNFGQLGTPPSHPKLLDYLAGQFVKHGWSIKKLHREIVLSETYQLASTTQEANLAKDPENEWLWHMPARRLTVEEFRDALLAVTGELDPSLGGDSGELDDPEFKRRTIYGKVSRHDLANVLRLFDFPNPTLSSDRRNETTLPQQMLYLLNSPFVIDRAKALAARATESDNATAQVEQLFRLTLQRSPATAERDAAVAYLAAEDREPNKLSRLERLAQSLLVSNEFYFVD